jgi:hypothetical protein
VASWKIDIELACFDQALHRGRTVARESIAMTEKKSGLDGTRK